MYTNNMMNKKYVLLEKGKRVPMTTCDTIEEIIDCVRAFEQVWREMYPEKADTSPYTIGQVEAV